MSSQFKLPSISKSLEPWRAFEVKITNIFLKGVDCFLAEKKKVAGFEVDCFALDNDVAYIVECKTKEELSKTNQKLKDYILLFAGKRRSISNDLRETDRKRELVFILCAQGFNIKEDHRKLASENGIYLWDEGFIKNIENLYAAIGPRVRQYVIQSLDIKEKIEDDTSYGSFRIPALSFETTINGIKKNIFTLFLSAEHLLDLGYVYHISNGDPEAYQRLLKTSRLKGIGDFINEDNTFNSSVVVIFPDDIRFEGLGNQDDYEYKTGFVFIPKLKSSLRIIDGQHRLYGYEWADPEHKKDKLPVIGLQNISPTDQAKIFLDINDHQSPVKKDDLNLIMARTDPYGTGFLPNVVLCVNDNSRSVLYRKFITPLDVTKKGHIRLANAVKGLSDRKLFSNSNPLIYNSVDKIDESIIEDCADVIDHFCETLINVAKEIDNKWISEFIFTNNGFNIALYLLAEIGKYYDHYKKHWLNKEIESGLRDYFTENMQRIDDIRQMSSEGGRRENAKALIYQINKYDRSFGARFIKDYEPNVDRSIRTKGEYLEEISGIENKLKVAVTLTLSQDNQNWWLTYVPNSIRNRINSEMKNEQESYFEISDRSKREDYLTFGDISFIVEKNWPRFSQLLNSKVNALSAIDAVKHVRNKLSHGRDVSDLSEDEKNQYRRASQNLQKRLKGYANS